MNLVIFTLIMNNYPRDFIKRISEEENLKDKRQTKRMC